MLGDVTGVTGLKIIRAILAGERDPQVLAQLRDQRCKHTVAEIATALDGRYRPEFLLELRCCLAMWAKYQEVIADVDTAIAGHSKAITAAAHKLARIIYNLMRYGLAYVKQEEAAYAAQVRERLEKQLRKRAKELGFELTKTESATAAPPVE